MSILVNIVISAVSLTTGLGFGAMSTLLLSLLLNEIRLDVDKLIKDEYSKVEVIKLLNNYPHKVKFE